MKRYGIEKIGYGKRACFVLKELLPRMCGTAPVDWRRYPSLQAAREAAARLGLVIEREGDFYALLIG